MDCFVYFRSDSLNESFDPVNKTPLNDLFNNWTNLFLLSEIFSMNQLIQLRKVDMFANQADLVLLSLIFWIVDPVHKPSLKDLFTNFGSFHSDLFKEWVDPDYETGVNDTVY